MVWIKSRIFAEALDRVGCQDLDGDLRMQDFNFSDRSTKGLTTTPVEHRKSRRARTTHQVSLESAKRLVLFNRSYHHIRIK
jgi:hypothetical protein